MKEFKSLKDFAKLVLWALKEGHIDLEVCLHLFEEFYECLDISNIKYLFKYFERATSVMPIEGRSVQVYLRIVKQIYRRLSKFKDAAFRRRIHLLSSSLLPCNHESSINIKGNYADNFPKIDEAGD